MYVHAAQHACAAGRHCSLVTKKKSHYVRTFELRATKKLGALHMVAGSPASSPPDQCKPLPPPDVGRFFFLAPRGGKKKKSTTSIKGTSLLLFVVAAGE